MHTVRNDTLRSVTYNVWVVLTCPGQYHISAVSLCSLPHCVHTCDSHLAFTSMLHSCLLYALCYSFLVFASNDFCCIASSCPVGLGSSLSLTLPLQTHTDLTSVLLPRVRVPAVQHLTPIDQIRITIRGDPLGLVWRPSGLF